MSPLLTISIVLASAIIIAGAVVILRNTLHEIKRKHYDQIIYKLTIPQFENQGKNEAKQGFRERASEVENLFSVLASIKAQKGLKTFFYGRDDHFSLEIVSQHDSIHFYAGVPKSFADIFVQQVHSVYPSANLEVVSDYNIFQPQATILGAYLTLQRSYVFPIKTYTLFESDPLEGLTTALSRVPQGGGAAIQYVLRSAPRNWHQAGRAVAKKVYDGASLKDAIKNQSSNGKGPLHIIGSIVKGIFSILGASFSSSSKDSPQHQTPRREISQKDQEAIKGIEDKTSKAAFEVNIRVIASTPDQAQAELLIRNILDSFGQYNIYEYGNAFKPYFVRRHDAIVENFIYRHFQDRASMILNAEELVSLFHLPEQIHTPNISWQSSRRIAAPVNEPTTGLHLGTNRYRGRETEVYMKDADRRRHTYIIGQTGTGKSTIMETMAVQDIQKGKGICIIDPHGDLVEKVLGQVPQERLDDVIYFNPADTDRPVALNMMEFDTPEQKTFVINEMINIFDKLYDLKQTGGPMFEQYMRNTMLLMMEDPASGSTLMEIPRVLSDERFRKFKLSKTTNSVVRDFWEKEAQKAGGDAALANMVPYITSKLTQFVSNDIMRPIISQQKSSFNFRSVMDSKKILLINLSKGRIGEMNSSLLGMVVVGKLLMAALSRVDIPEEERNDFYLYIDEFQNYTTDSIAIILSEARKYRLVLTIAHQYLGQLSKGGDTTIKDAVFGNVGTILAYRVGVEDAPVFAEQFAPVVSEYDAMNIDKFNYYIRQLIDNQNAPAFNCLAPAPSEGDPRIAQLIKDHSRTKFGRPREEVEREILERSAIRPKVNAPLPPTT